MEWCLVKHRDNFSFAFNFASVSDLIKGVLLRQIIIVMNFVSVHYDIDVHFGYQ